MLDRIAGRATIHHRPRQDSHRKARNALARSLVSVISDLYFGSTSIKFPFTIRMCHPHRLHVALAASTATSSDLQPVQRNGKSNFVMPCVFRCLDYEAICCRTVSNDSFSICSTFCRRSHLSWGMCCSIASLTRRRVFVTAIETYRRMEISFTVTLPPVT